MCLGGHLALRAAVGFFSLFPFFLLSILFLSRLVERLTRTTNIYGFAPSPIQLEP